MTSNNLPAAAEPTAVGYQAYDVDSGQHVAVTQEMIVQANEIHAAIAGAQGQILWSIHLIGRDRLYLALGCKSFREYCDTYLERLGISSRTARRYRRIGERLPSTLERLVASGGQIQVNKLDLVASLSDEQVENIESMDEIELQNGDVVTGAQLLDRTQRELRDTVKKLRDENDSLKGRLDRSAIKLEAATAELENVKDASKLAKMYDEVSKQLEEIRGQLIEAEKARDTWQRLEQDFDKQLALIDRIPDVSDEGTREYALGVVDGLIRRANALKQRRFGS